MKKISSIIYLVLLVSSCTTFQEKSIVPHNEILNAVISDETTKTYLDQQRQNRWVADDRISAYVGNTYNQQYAFQGSTGDNAGDFSKVQGGGLSTGEDLNAIYAIYPYASSNSISENGVITVELPHIQKYTADSFGQGANTMVAVTAGVDDSFLKFKNICGYLIIKVYGDAQITSITLSGNNGEKISGKAKITPSYSGIPSVAMDNAANSSITLDCGSGVSLGSGSASATSFWFALPPTNFSKGISITVKSADGKIMTKSTDKSISVARNTYYTLSPFKYEGKGDESANITIPDANFKAYLVENFDKDGDGEIVLDEGRDITYINVGTNNIMSLQGIECFPNLKTLYAYGSWDNDAQKYDGKLTELDVSNNTALTSLHCYSNQLSSLDVSNNTALTTLYCYLNQLSSLDVRNNTALTYLDCCLNQLSSLDVSNNTALTYLSCGSNQLSSLDVSNNTALTYLSCYSNQLSSLDVSNNTALTSLGCDGNQLSSLDVSNNTALTYLHCHSNQLSSLDISKNTSLTYLLCSWNQLSSLDVSNNTALTDLYCSCNQLSSLDVSNNTALTSLDCGSNQLSSLDVSNNTALTSLYCSWNQLSSLDVSSNTLLHSLSCFSNKPLTVYLTTGQYIENISKNENVTLVYGGDKINIPDANFKRYLVNNFDRNGDGEISYTEGLDITYINVGTNNIMSLQGIECFPNLKTLYAYGSWDSNEQKYKGLQQLDVSNNTSLTELGCGSNQLSSLDVSNNTALTWLDCGSNQLSSLDVSNNTALTSLDCGGNQLSSLDVSNNTALTSLYCGYNQLSSLDVSNNTALTDLSCGSNQLSSLDVSNNTALTSLSCDSNQLSSLDVSNNTALTYLRCDSNQLSSLDVSNNMALTNLYCYNNQYLQEIWLKSGQVIVTFGYNSNVATIKYK